MLSMSMVNVMMGCREESDLDDKAGVVLSRPGPEALYRPGQARPTHRAYEGLGPEALASDSLV